MRGLSVVGEDGSPGSERLEETERRFVRIGVRDGYAGGALDDDEPIVVLVLWVIRGGREGVTSSSSMTVSGCLVVEVEEDRAAALRIVLSLGLR